MESRSDRETLERQARPLSHDLPPTTPEAIALQALVDRLGLDIAEDDGDE